MKPSELALHRRGQTTLLRTSLEISSLSLLRKATYMAAVVNVISILSGYREHTSRRPRIVKRDGPHPRDIVEEHEVVQEVLESGFSIPQDSVPF
jgi:hypothetical protein